MLKQSLFFPSADNLTTMTLSFAMVVADVVPNMVEVNLQTAQSEVAHAVRTFNEVLLDELMSLFLVPLKDEFSHLWQVFQRLAAIVVVWRTRPKCLFVKLYLVVHGSSIDHRAEVRVAYRQRLEPVGCVSSVIDYCL